MGFGIMNPHRMKVCQGIDGKGQIVSQVWPYIVFFEGIFDKYGPSASSCIFNYFHRSQQTRLDIYPNFDSIRSERLALPKSH